MADKVRALEWRSAGHDGQSLEASAFGVEVAYRISGKPGDWTLTSIGMREYIHTPGYQTRATARAAAQVDFARRILAELTPAPEAAPIRTDRGPYPEALGSLSVPLLLSAAQIMDGQAIGGVHPGATAIYALLDYATKQAPEAAQTEAVAWAETYDGGHHYNTVSLIKTQHHTVPLYARPPAAQDSVRKAALKWAELEKESESRISMGGWSTKAQELDLFEAEEAMKDAALRALAGKGGA